MGFILMKIQYFLYICSAVRFRAFGLVRVCEINVEKYEKDNFYDGVCLIGYGGV